MFLELPILIFLLLLSATLLSAAFQGATGFGYGLMAVPLYLLILGTKDAVQISFIVMLFISISLVPSIYRDLDKTLFLRLALGSAAGFVFGTYLYIASDVELLKILVGLSLILTVSVFLFSAKQLKPRPPGPGKEIATGLISGSFACSIALPGPPVLVYMTSHGFTKDQIRTTNLALMLFSNIGAIIAQVMFVGISLGTVKVSGVLSLVAILGALVGARLTRLLNEEIFRKLIIAVLALTGVYMTIRSLFY